MIIAMTSSQNVDGNQKIVSYEYWIINLTQKEMPFSVANIQGRFPLCDTAVMQDVSFVY